ncbi:MAG: cytochrome b562 [Planctomycetota bacterium]
MTTVRPSRRRLVSILLAGSVLVGVAFGVHARSAAAARATPAVSDAVEQSMRQMNAAMKVLGKGITAETRDNTLQQLSKFQAAVVAAKELTPASIEQVAEDKRAEYLVGFRKQMVEVLKVAGDAEIAVLDGKYDVAQELVRAKLGGLKKEGHDKYQHE